MIKKGNLIYRVLFAVIAIVTAFVCVSLSMQQSEKKIYAASTKVKIGDDYYSYKDDANNAILNVEKVGVVMNNDGAIDTSTSINVNDMTSALAYSSEYEQINYSNITKDATSRRSYVDNGEVVMLNNTTPTGVGDQKGYYNKDLVETSSKKVTEAVLVSFGQFWTETSIDANGNPTVSVISPSNTENAGVDWIGLKAGAIEESIITHNGEKFDVEFRTLSGLDVAGHMDFAFIIPQKEGNDGYYKLSFAYSIGGSTYELDFEFYIVFKSSYQETLLDEIDNKTYEYSAMPKVSWLDLDGSGNPITTYANGTVSPYKIGESGIIEDTTYYPILTYDYTKYALSYTHTANKKKTKYEYIFDSNSVVKAANGSCLEAYMYLKIDDGEPRKIDISSTHKIIDVSNNYISIVLTEAGSYHFDYNYVYTNYLPDGYEAPEINIDVSGENQAKVLSMHGFKLNYSKYLYKEAELKHLIISNNSQKVACVVPNGINLTAGDKNKQDLKDYQNGAIGFTYEFDNTATDKVGSVSVSKSKQAMVDKSTVSTLTSSDNLEDLKVYDASASDDLKTAIASITYQETNQGSLWFKNHDKFTEESFYFYSPDKITYENGIFIQTAGQYTPADTGDDVYSSKTYKNETSFNKTGYYLVFIQVNPEGVTGAEYYQVFAFRYTTNTIEINVHELNEHDELTSKVIGANKYTDKNVQVSWTKPQLFERGVGAYYYTTKNPNATIQEITKGTVNQISPSIDDNKMYANLGYQVGDNDYLKFLIVLESEGGSKTYRTFTIDREDISGVETIAVEEKNTNTSGSYYRAMYGANKEIKVVRGITNTLATLNWNNKNSGAKITAEYYYAPFVQDSSVELREITVSAESWYYTRYKLGSELGPFDFSRPNDMSNIDYYKSVLEKQGIYLFDIEDEAGNSTRYMFVIDSTESYFSINGEFICKESRIYGSEVEVKAGDYKVFKIDLSACIEIGKIVQNLTNGSKTEKDVNYFGGSGSNYGNLKNLFKYINSSDYYFTVRNTALKIYDMNYNYEGQYTTHPLKYNLVKEDGSTSTVKNLRLDGLNHEDVKSAGINVVSNSYIRIEINTDNSRGMVFAKDTVFSDVVDVEDEENQQYRVYTDNDDEATNKSGLIKANATSSKYVVFSWIQATGTFEINSVKYDYYPLDTEYFDNNKYFFYSRANASIDNMMYEKGAAKRDNYNESNGKATFKLYNGDSVTNPGLYVVTREYVNDDNLGEDKQTVNYYFIVDRDGVYELSDEARNNIAINLLGKDATTNEFNGGIKGSPVIEKKMVAGEQKEVKYDYNIYLNTNKVPVILDVPIAKYINAKGNTSGYYAGQMTYTLYFFDDYKQLSNTEGSQETLCSGDVKINSQGYASIDLSKVNSKYKDKFLLAGNNTEWICLPGTYVLVIEDNVLNIDKRSHYFAIGFTIKKPNVDEDSPVVQYASGYNGNNLTNIELSKTETTIYTSEEYIAFILPEYKSGEKEDPQVDPYYFDIKIKKEGEIQKDYLYYKYSKDDSKYNGKILNEGDINGLVDSDKSIIKMVNGSRYIYLDTFLRNPDGSINTQSITYTVTVRYRLIEGNQNPSDTYKNAYYYYKSYLDTEKTSYYERTYTIEIDRTPPKSNITNLINNDNILEHYLAEGDNLDDFFVQDMHGGTNSKATHSYQYKYYYESKQNFKTDSSKIYAFRVTKDQIFTVESDLAKVMYKSYNNELSLPIIESNYTNVNLSNTPQNYGSILKENGNALDAGYYEIVEIDKANNVTQYVVYFDHNESHAEYADEFKLSFVITGPGNASELNINNANGMQQTIYSITPKDSGHVIEKNKYYYIKITKDGKVKEITTNYNTVANDLATMVAKVFNEEFGFGNYTVEIQDSYSDKVVFKIDYYDSQDMANINISDIIIQNPDGTYMLDLSKAKTIDKGITVYAKEITINGITYTGELNEDSLIFEDDEGNLVGQIDCDNDTTYIISAEDTLGRPSFTIFNPKGNANEWIESNANMYLYNNTYYAFAQVELGYNTEVYNDSRIVIKKNGVIITGTELNEYIDNGKISLPFGNGVLNTYEVQFIWENLQQSASYKVVIDGFIGNVRLRDNATGDDKDILEIKHNLKNGYLDDEATVGTKETSGIMNLTWERPNENHNHFIYIYELYRLDGKDSQGKEKYTKIYLSDTATGQQINTPSGSTGIYKLQITVYPNIELEDGGYLDSIGNVVYVFKVNNKNANLYTVVDKLNGNQIVKPNAEFTFADLTGYILDGDKYPTGSTTPYPLFITNSVYEPMDNDIVTITPETLEHKGIKDILTLYTVDVGTFKQYFLILMVDNLDGELLTGLKYKVNNNATSITGGSWSIDILGNVGDNIELTGKVLSAVNTNDVTSHIQNILKKNILSVTIYHNGKLATTKTVDLDVYSNFSLPINGDGKYSIRIEDLAGNVHMFTKNDNEDSQNYLDVYIMRELSLTLNGKLYIENTYFNDPVKVELMNQNKYKSYSFKIESATCDGREYKAEGSNPYIFSNYGFYNVKFNATYYSNGEERTVSKTIQFSIINKNEARTAIDLTTIGSYNIEKILDANNIDRIEIFKNIINPNLESGMLLSYERLLEFSKELNISSGKKMFTITYTVVDKNNFYPTETFTFSFTLNNELPKVNCSLASGESSNQGFEISFNEGAIYEQIGDSYIYINNERVGVIDYRSQYAQTTINKNFKSDGAGDYYITLVSSSGTILQSFKVTITEPLNTWAIILIVVITAVVVTVVVVVIVLRRKMRIR